ncbi:hypothetical protein J2S05_003192 [Alkalicoccobacillus murimartini]|uniref:Uncharacterized protein n=1 Tax=Alkalicoccobacillus murimartini TaxID=171685 RepID=A0ABT9YLL3_9BACI|nr:hypothetical protein [Alkalicoccobacillus murimartini]
MKIYQDTKGVSKKELSQSKPDPILVRDEGHD